MVPWWNGTDTFTSFVTYIYWQQEWTWQDRRKFDRLWTIRDLFEILNATFSKFYDPSKNLAIDEVIVSFKGRVIFRQYIPKKRKRFGIKIFKLCDSTGCTYDMKVYLGKDRQRMAQHLTATHATVTILTRKVEGRGHKLYMDNGQFFLPWIIWWLGQETDLLLWQCQARQERHATRPSTKDNKTEKRRYSRKNQGWLYGNTVAGQESQTFECWRTFTFPQQKIISALKEEKL